MIGNIKTQYYVTLVAIEFIAFALMVKYAPDLAGAWFTIIQAIRLR